MQSTVSERAQPLPRPPRTARTVAPPPDDPARSDPPRLPSENSLHWAVTSRSFDSRSEEEPRTATGGAPPPRRNYGSGGIRRSPFLTQTLSAPTPWMNP